MNSRSAFSTKRLRSPAGAAERNATFQYRLLRLLAANPVRTQNELAAELGSHGATVNAHLKILKDQGYIESGDYGHLDRFVRKCHYQVTPAGSQQCRTLGRAQRESKTQEMAALQAEATRVRAEINRLDAEITRLRAEVTSLRAELGIYPLSPRVGEGKAGAA